MQWMSDLVQWVRDWFPRIELLQSNQAGIKFLPGGRTKLLTPGLYVYWPITTAVTVIETRRRGVNITQRLTTWDGVTVLAEVTVIFNISDAYKAIVDTTDFASTILESAQEASIEPITTRTFDDCCVAVSNKGLRSELTPALRKSLRLYGVYVEKAFISDFSRTKVLCHEGSINTGGCESE